MPSSLLIAGCGYLGTAVGRRFAERDWKVWGVRRDPVVAAGLVEARIDPLIGDLTDTKFLNRLPTPNILLIGASPSRESDSYSKTYLDIAKGLVARYGRETLKKIIYISSTGVYSTNDGSWVDEVTDPKPDNEHSQILLDAEKAVLQSVHPVVVFRLAGFYGPGRNRIGPIRSGKFKPALSESFTNRIHLEDAVAAIDLLIQRGKTGELYLGADDQPSTQKEFYSWLYGQMGLPLPQGGSDRMHPATGASVGRGEGSNKRCWNGKIKQLGLKLKFPTYKEGYVDLLTACA